MREILFRGKTKGKQKGTLTDKPIKANMWVYGSYDCGALCGYEIDMISDKKETYAIVPETRGQYTGLTDKNGKKIFEGDIVKARVTENTGYGTKKYESIYEIKYHEKYCYFYLAREKNNLLFDGNWSYFVSQFEIIGNIHDNPELLKGGEE